MVDEFINAGWTQSRKRIRAKNGPFFPTLVSLFQVPEIEAGCKNIIHECKLRQRILEIPHGLLVISGSLQTVE
jgi:hypothetical protein